MDYDKENGTDLVGTLKEFMKSGFNVTHAAETLYLHRTTLLKHLKKIESISGIHPGDTKEALHVGLSFRFLGL